MKAFEQVVKDMEQAMHKNMTNPTSGRIRRVLNNTDMDPSKMDFGSFNKTVEHFMKLETFETPKEMYDYTMKNPDMFNEFNSKQMSDLRALVRKFLKPQMKDAVLKYHA
jgi:hypothetical protein